MQVVVYSFPHFFSCKNKIKMNFDNLLKKNFLKFDDVKKLHFELTNIVCIAREKDETWYFFCDEITCCHFEQKKCTLCLFCDKLFEKKLIDNMEAENFY